MNLQVLFLIHLAATLFMTGVIWFVQIVHYPLFSAVGHEEFVSYEAAHQRLTTWVVMPAMLIELGTGLILIHLTRDGRLHLPMLLGMVLVGVIWLATFLLSVPAHQSLSQQFSNAAHRKLVQTNWIRTVCWTLRSTGLVWLFCSHWVRKP